MEKKKIVAIILSVLLAAGGYFFGAEFKESVCECEKYCESK